jgi:hypothetical protein
MQMNSMQIGVRKIGEILMKNSPSILTGLGVAGMVTTVVMAVSATPKAIKILEEEQERRRINSVSQGWGDEVLPTPKIEAVKLVWKCYAPSVVMGTVTIACIIGANSINTRRYAALAGIYSLTDTALREYQAKVVETLGKGKEEKIREELAQDKLDKDPVSTKQVIITGNGETLCYDTLSGRYFKSDIETIRRIQNNFNSELLSDIYRPLNDFYDELGLEGTEMGRDMGWAVEYGLLDIHFTTKLANDGRPCLVLEYRVGPRKL